MVNNSGMECNCYFYKTRSSTEMLQFNKTTKNKITLVHNYTSTRAKICSKYCCRNYSLTL